MAAQKLNREQKIAKARRLRGQGLSFEQIGEQLDVAHSTVFKWLNPERQKEYSQRHDSSPERLEQKRLWAHSHRAACEDCGALRGAGTAIPSRRGGGRCRTCHELHLAELADPGRRKLEKLWNEGLSYAEMQDALGWSRGHLSKAIHDARAAGYHLPYRRRPGVRNATRFPEQVDA